MTDQNNIQYPTSGIQHPASNTQYHKKLNIYFTAGVPELQDTTKVLKIIQSSGAEMVEIGMPYSDPVAD